ncbi:MAG: hypothetical protein HOV80_06240 [Polyangiaceae bacterium]|nr:hypothetical protein [Polyangiaceae bacterium]
MKPVKFVVLGAAALASIGVFLDWIAVTGDVPALIRDAMPKSGMENGGPIFLFFLAMPLLAAGIGAAKRFGRGLSVLAIIGSALASLLALVKWADIESAGDELAKLGGGGSVGVAPGYWLVFFGATIALFASFVTLIKPEPKLQPAYPAR